MDNHAPRRPGRSSPPCAGRRSSPPPIMTGCAGRGVPAPRRHAPSRRATGVISPLRQMQSAPHPPPRRLFAATRPSRLDPLFRIRCRPSRPPRYSFRCRASPFTVAISTLPARFGPRPPPLLDVGRKRHGALHHAGGFTTCGRNILPSPKSVPTCSMAASAACRSRPSGCPGLRNPPAHPAR